MIDQTSQINLERPEHNFGVAPLPYLVRLDEGERKIYRNFNLFVAFPLAVVIISAFVLGHSVLMIIGGIAMITAHLIPFLCVNNLKCSLQREYSALVEEKVAEWVRDKLFFYLLEERGITLMDIDYMSLIQPMSQGLKARTEAGEIIRLKLEGFHTKNHRDFIDIILLRPYDFAVMTTQKGFMP